MCIYHIICIHTHLCKKKQYKAHTYHRMYICVYIIYTYVYMRVYIIRVYICVYILTHTHVCISLHICVCVYCCIYIAFFTENKADGKWELVDKLSEIRKVYCSELLPWNRSYSHVSDIHTSFMSHVSYSHVSDIHTYHMSFCRGTGLFCT
jgi:hypothetical protein